MSYTAWSVVYGEQPSASKWNQLGTNDAYFDGLVGSGTAWTTWSPSLTNITAGNGTVLAKYQQLGKNINYKFKFTLGSTSSISSSPKFTLPTTPSVNTYASGADGDVMGIAQFSDTPGTSHHPGEVRLDASATVIFYCWNTAGTNASAATVNSTTPLTFGTSDSLLAFGTYETT